MRRYLTVLVSAAIALTLMAVPASAATQPHGVVTVVHGVPDLTVDVYLNGELALEDFATETITGPLLLPAVDYDIQIFEANADPDTTEPVIEALGVALPAGADVAIVAHLAPDPGDPAADPVATASVFVNDLTRLDAGEARVTLRHTAAAPEVDVYAEGTLNLTEDAAFTSGTEAVADVPAGTYDVTVNTPGDPDDVLFDVGAVTLTEGVNTIAYAIGVFPDMFTVMVDQISGLGPDGRFTDDNGDVHEANIDIMARVGITLGCNPPENTEYCPFDNVSRGEIAAFLRRTLSLPASGTDFFTDDDGHVFEDDINALAEAGIAKGHDDGTYGPDDPMTRGEMAAFLNRSFTPGPSAVDAFTDDDDSIFEADIDAIAAADITKGCNPPEDTQYCPTRNVLRSEMASFLARALGLGT